jgi:hypothetical protein
MGGTDAKTQPTEYAIGWVNYGQKRGGSRDRIEKVSSMTLFLDRVGQLWLKKRRE